jgi:hypothetical protein
MAEQSTGSSGPEVSQEDIRALCGELLDWKVEAILELGPTVADVATAAAWANGQDELGREGRPLDGLASQIYDLLVSDADYDDRD